MKRERWQRVRQILEAALEKSQEDRTNFLDQACASDPALRKEVDSLLVHRNDAESFLEDPPMSGINMALTEGTRLGSFEIVSPLGAGGMGEVYLAKDLELGMCLSRC